MSPDFMQRAIALALENVRSGSGGPFAALIVKENRVIAEGTNRVTSTNDPTAHAEIVAIREACRVLADFQLTGCDLYTTCEPCPMCLGAIYWTRPGRILYAANAATALARPLVPGANPPAVPGDTRCDRLAPRFRAESSGRRRAESSRTNRFWDFSPV